MDRNCEGVFLLRKITVALRKESVDRNHKDLTKWFSNYGSLSARRAWIEIFSRGWTLNINGSLSARRAWIEIQKIAKKY